MYYKVGTRYIVALQVTVLCSNENRYTNDKPDGSLLD